MTTRPLVNFLNEHPKRNIRDLLFYIDPYREEINALPIEGEIPQRRSLIHRVKEGIASEIYNY
jgi:hypothetical protein